MCEGTTGELIRQSLHANYWKHLDSAINITQRHIEAIRGHGAKKREQIEKMEACSDDTPCGLLVCRHCLHHQRLKLLPEYGVHFDRYKRLHPDSREMFVTVLIEDYSLKEFTESFDLLKTRKQLDRKLRPLLQGTPALCLIEIAPKREEGIDSFILHAHICFFNWSSEIEKVLRREFPKKRAVHSKNLKSFHEAVAYGTKLSTAIKIGGDQRPAGRHVLKALCDLYLDHKLGDFILFINRNTRKEKFEPQPLEDSTAGGWHCPPGDRRGPKLSGELQDEIEDGVMTHMKNGEISEKCEKNPGEGIEMAEHRVSDDSSSLYMSEDSERIGDNIKAECIIINYISKDKMEYSTRFRFRGVTGEIEYTDLPWEIIGKPAQILSLLARGGYSPSGKDREAIIDAVTEQYNDPALPIANKGKPNGWKDSSCQSFSSGELTLPPPAAPVKEIRLEPELHAKGRLSGWTRDVAGPLGQSNPGILALCMALTGPLLLPSASRPFGIHFYGKTSSGKTTILDAAQSVWTKPDNLTWNSTRAGLQEPFEQARDTLLRVDEIAAAASTATEGPNLVADVIMQLFDGGRSRQGSGAAADPRTLLLSAGEVSIADFLRNATKPVNDGLDVRMMSIGIDHPNGVLDAWNGEGSPGERSRTIDRIQNGTRQHYGHAGAAFVKALLEQEDMTGLIKDSCDRSAKDLDLDRFSGPEGRIGKHFALMLTAGRLAIRFGILPFSGEQVLQAVKQSWNATLTAWRTKSDPGFGMFSELMAAVQKDHKDNSSIIRPSEVKNASEGEYLAVYQAGPSPMLFFRRERLKALVSEACLKTATAYLRRKGAIQLTPTGKTSIEKAFPGAKKQRYLVVDLSRTEATFTLNPEEKPKKQTKRRALRAPSSPDECSRRAQRLKRVFGKGEIGHCR